MRIVWTLAALEQLDSIHEYIARTSPIYALDVVRRLWHRTSQIAAFPQSGRVVSEHNRPDIRELIEPPYRLMYQIGTDRIHVLAIVHSGRGSAGEAP